MKKINKKNQALHVSKGAPNFEVNFLFLNSPICIGGGGVHFLYTMKYVRC